VRTVAGTLGGLLEFLGPPVALELRDVDDEEKAIEMVDLALRKAGERALGQNFARRGGSTSFFSPRDCYTEKSLEKIGIPNVSFQPDSAAANLLSRF
jgi:hypothetical protein